MPGSGISRSSTVLVLLSSTLPLQDKRGPTQLEDRLSPLTLELPVTPSEGTWTKPLPNPCCPRLPSRPTSHRLHAHPAECSRWWKSSSPPDCILALQGLPAAALSSSLSIRNKPFSLFLPATGQRGLDQCRGRATHLATGFATHPHPAAALQGSPSFPTS